MPSDSEIELTLYHFPRTLSTRARWWLEEAEVPYRAIEVDIRRREQDTPEFRKISPFGQIPVLIDGDLILRESLAITLHLGFRFPNANLTPQNGTSEFSKYLQWLSLGATESHRVVGNAIVTQRAKKLGARNVDVSSARDDLDQLLEIYERQLDETRYLSGDTMSGADLANASMFAFADSVGLVPSSGKLRDWLDMLTALPSYQRALEPAIAASTEGN